MKFSELPNDSTLKTFIVASALCLVCSVLVSAAAVGLKPKQAENKLIDRQKNILRVVGLYEPGVDVTEAFKQFEPKVVDLETGNYVPGVDAESFDQAKAAKDPKTSIALSGAEDIARIKRRANKAKIYLLRGEDGKVKEYILPVKGYGLWSTMYGYIALENDAQTVKGLIFYDQAETPGLGGEVDNPAWRAQWNGKKVYGADGEVELSVIKGMVDPSSPKAPYQVDGLAGATLTSRGVSNLVHFWLGENGFKPFLDKVRS